MYVAPSRAIAWNTDIDLCADALYLRLTGLSIGEVYPLPEAQPSDA